MQFARIALAGVVWVVVPCLALAQSAGAQPGLRDRSERRHAGASSADTRGYPSADGDGRLS